MEFKCSDCSYTSPARDAVIRHIGRKKKCGANSTIIAIEGNIKCTHCNGVYKTRKLLIKHYKTCKAKNSTIPIVKTNPSVIIIDNIAYVQCGAIHTAHELITRMYNDNDNIKNTSHNAPIINMDYIDTNYNTPNIGANCDAPIIDMDYNKSIIDTNCDTPIIDMDYNESNTDTNCDIPNKSYKIYCLENMLRIFVEKLYYENLQKNNIIYADMLKRAIIMKILNNKNDPNPNPNNLLCDVSKNIKFKNDKSKTRSSINTVKTSKHIRYGRYDR